LKHVKWTFQIWYRLINMSMAVLAKPTDGKLSPKSSSIARSLDDSEDFYYIIHWLLHSVHIFSMTVTLGNFGVTAGWKTLKWFGGRIGWIWANVCKTVHPMLSDSCLSVTLSVCLSCNVGVLWPNGWMDQHATSYGGRTRPRPHCVRWEPSSPQRGTAASAHFSAHVYCNQTVAQLSNCWALVQQHTSAQTG